MPNYHIKKKYEWNIAKKLYFSDEGQQLTSRPAIRVACMGIIVGMIVMIVAICVVVGFKEEIQQKVAGFGSHIQVVNFDNNSTYELQPIEVGDSLMLKIQSIPHVQQVATFTSKPGIIKTDSAFHGIIFKGTNYWEYFSNNLIIGVLPNATNEVIISTLLASQLQLEVGDEIFCYFIEDNLRVRKFYIVGLYNTCMSEMDKMFVLGHIDVVRRLNGWNEKQASGLEILIDDLRHLQWTADRIYFATANRLDEAGNALYTQTIEQVNPQIFAWLDLLDMNVVVIIILMLCVSGFSIITGLVILILESVSLIGTLKALGANNGFIRRIFVNQAILLVSKGMIIGNIIGLVIVTIQYFTHVLPLDAATYYVSYVPMAFPWIWIAILNIGVLIISGIILIAPSAIVSQISPAKVMHFE